MTEKPTVLYFGKPVFKGGRAYFEAIANHPVLGSCSYTYTSLIVCKDETGRIETLSSIYIPQPNPEKNQSKMDFFASSRADLLAYQESISKKNSLNASVEDSQLDGDAAAQAN